MKLFGTLLTLAGVLIYTHLQQNIKSGWELREKAKTPANDQQMPLKLIEHDHREDIETGGTNLK